MDCDRRMLQTCNYLRVCLYGSSWQKIGQPGVNDELLRTFKYYSHGLERFQNPAKEIWSFNICKRIFQKMNESWTADIVGITSITYYKKFNEILGYAYLNNRTYVRRIKWNRSMQTIDNAVVTTTEAEKKPNIMGIYAIDFGIFGIVRAHKYVDLLAIWETKPSWIV